MERKDQIQMKKEESKESKQKGIVRIGKKTKERIYKEKIEEKKRYKRGDMGVRKEENEREKEGGS